MRRKSNNVNFNLGSSSLLLIFVVMSLVSFAVLSLSTALSDKNMAQKNLDRNIAYYDACNLAQDKLALIDDAFCDIYLNADSEENYLSECAKAVGELGLEVVDFQKNVDSSKVVDDNVNSSEAVDDIYTELDLNKNITSSFIIPVSDYQGLQVVIKPIYPSDENSKLFFIKSWKLIYTAEPDIDFSVDVIK